MSAYFNSTIVAAHATGSIAVNSTPDDGDTVTISGGTFTFGVGLQVDTASGDTAVIAANLATAIQANLLGWSASPSGNSIAITAAYVGSGLNNAITQSGSSLSLSGMSGGQDASGASGKIDDAANLWSDSGDTTPLGRTLSSADNLIVQDVPTNGSATVSTVTDAGSNPMTGGTLTVSSAAACGYAVAGGTLICANYAGNHSAGTVTMKPASGAVTYAPLADGGTTDFTTYKSTITLTTITLGTVNVTIGSPPVADVASGDSYGISSGLTGALAVPANSDVRSGVGSGTCHVPAKADVRTGVPVDVSDTGTYGGSGGSRSRQQLGI